MDLMFTYLVRERYKIVSVEKKMCGRPYPPLYLV